jgi:TetR/AcrR family transcriptional repressor of nem operon
MNTREEIVRCADRLQRQRGYAGWSFGDISAEVELRRASIHHHFPTKGALLAAVVELNLEAGRQVALSLAGLSPALQLRAFFEGYRALLASDTLCPCGALTVDLPGLPEEAAAAATRYVDELRAWLAHVLSSGQAAGEVRRSAPPEAQAELVISAVQGALQHARARRDPAPLEQVTAQLCALLLEET